MGIGEHELSYVPHKRKEIWKAHISSENVFQQKSSSLYTLQFYYLPLKRRRISNQSITIFKNTSSKNAYR